MKWFSGRRKGSTRCYNSLICLNTVCRVVIFRDITLSDWFIWLPDKALQADTTIRPACPLRSIFKGCCYSRGKLNDLLGGPRAGQGAWNMAAIKDICQSCRQLWSAVDMCDSVMFAVVNYWVIRNSVLGVLLRTQACAGSNFTHIYICNKIGKGH